MPNDRFDVNDIFRDQQAMIRFGLAIEPFFGDGKVDKTITDLVKVFTKRLAHRLNPNFFQLLIGLLSTDDPRKKSAGVNVLNIALGWAAEHVTNAKTLLTRLVEAYLKTPEDLTSSRHLAFARLICLLHGVGQSTNRAPHPALMNLYEQAYCRNDMMAKQLLEQLRFITIDQYIFLIPEVKGELPPGLMQTDFELAEWRCADSVIVKGVFSSILADLDQAADLADETVAQITRIEVEQLKIEDKLAGMWDKIAQEPNFDVLDSGGDSFEVTGWLKRVGIERITFLREGFQFPNVGIRVVWRFFDQTYASRHQLTPQVSASDQPESKKMQLPLFIVGTHCYNQIVCAQPRQGQASSRKIQRPEPIGGRSVQVRAHFRRLLPGWKPSPEQVQAALLRLGYIKDGYTFVLPHRRGTPSANQGNFSPAQPIQSTPKISFEQIIEEFL